MKNLDLGTPLSRDQQKKIQGGSWLYFCGGTLKTFSSLQDCLHQGQVWCFSGNFSCTNTGGGEVDQ